MIQKQKGTKDVLPSEAYKWDEIEKILKKVAKSNGFLEMRTPTFENTELFIRGIGDTTDVVQKEMYTFIDKGNNSITLKPEGTAPAVRAFIEGSLYNEVQPTKIFYITPVFRYENTQNGRYREHHQFGCECFGGKNPTLDAELINIVNTILVNNFKLENIELVINSIGCEKCRPIYIEKLKEFLRDNIDDLCEDCKKRFEKNPLRALDCKEEGCKKISKNAPSILEFLCDECNDHFDELKEVLDLLNIKYEVDNKIVRGLDYYTKTVFEFKHNGLAVCGGGRYDKLISQIGKPDLPAVGFGMGIERLILTLENSSYEFEKDDKLDLFLCSFDKESKMETFKICNDLRKMGIRVDINHVDRSFKAQMKYTNNIGVKFTIVVGEDEIKTRKCKLKNMYTGENVEISLDDCEKIYNLVKEGTEK